MLRSSIFAWFIFYFLTPGLTQSKKEVKELMLQNEESFISIVSSFYPLTKTQIEAFQNELNFIDLSKNTKIDWTDEFIDLYKNRLSLHSLLSNKGIQWDEEKIKKYKDEEWFSYRSLALNNKLYISDELFEIDKHKIDAHLLNVKSDSVGHVLLNYSFEPRGYSKLEEFVSIPYEKRINNYIYPPEFQKLLQSDIGQVDFNLLLANGDVINWNKYFKYADIDWTWEKLAQLEGLIKFVDIDNNEELVNDLFLSKLKNADIDELMFTLKTKNENRLYEISNHIANGGLVQNVEFENLLSGDFQKENQKIEYFPDELINSKIIINHGDGEPQDFIDYYEFSSWTQIPAKVVSSKLKSILENFNLPKHKFYPFVLSMTSEDWGTDTREYYLFLCDTLMQGDIEYDKTVFSKTGLLKHDTVIISDAKQVSIKDRRLDIMPNSYPKYKDYRWKEIYIDNDYDLSNVSGKGLWLSQRLYDCIQENEIVGISRFSNNPYKIFNKEKPELETSCSTIESGNNYQSAIALRYDAAVDSLNLLIANAPKEYVKSLYPNRGKFSKKERDIIDFEIRSDIVLPKIFREYLLNPDDYIISAKIKEFELFNVEGLQPSGNDGWDVNPKARKSIGIAGNGVGDYLALFLEEGNPHHLGTQIYALMYGGEIIKLEDLTSIIIKK